ncbi:thiocillin family RiPP [Cryptosporangium minutisporangium]|uniref:Thiocillin family RiPP n=1 Tax=Cryptosporangium minutisporangium TaxID=113569 RepID=A0ABP6SZ54_9ACTN
MDEQRNELELSASAEDLEFESLADGNALASVATAGSASTASCPATSASSVSSASTYT